MPKPTQLFEEFDAVSLEEWKAKVIKDLKGKPYDSLQWQLSEDIKMEPFYTESKTNIAFPHKKDNDWQISEDFIANNNLKAVNKQLLEALMGGINAPRISIQGSMTEQDWAILFKEVEFDYISTHIRFIDKTSTNASLGSLKAYLESIGKNMSTLNGSISGTSFLDGMNMNSVDVIANKFYTETAGIPRELAQTIHLGVNQVMTASKKASIDQVLQAIYFNIRIGKSYFPAMAKIRALDILWQRICEGFGTEYVTPEIEVEFSPSAYGENPNTNMIRATTMAMSAVLGGADRLVVLPSNLEEENPSPFSRRIARNIQHLLKMESFLDQVADPAAGSYYIERMTNVFVEKAWEKFLELEKSPTS